MQTVHVEDIKHRLLAHFFSSVPSPAALVRRFCAIQVDGVSIVAPNQSLVLAARFSTPTIPNLVDLYSRCDIVEVYAKERCIVMREDAPLFWPLLQERRERHNPIFKEHRVEIRRVLEYAKKSGSIAAGILDSTNTASDGGWGPKRLGTKLINLLWETGALVVKSRIGTRSIYAPAPDGLWSSSARSSSEEIRIARWKRYLEGVAITDNHDTFAGFERCPAVKRRSLLSTLVESGAAARVAGLADKTFCVFSTRLLGAEGEPDTLPCFIPPLDNFLWHRRLFNDLWGLNYRWEIYVPPNRREHGPYAMPLITPGGVHGPVDFRVNRADQILCGEFSKSPLQRSSKTVRAAAEVAAFKLADAVGVKNVRLL